LKLHPENVREIKIVQEIILYILMKFKITSSFICLNQISFSL
jgi:hypothetical protein